MTIFEARAKRLKDELYRFVCGRRDIETGPCAGHLGDASWVRDARLDTHFGDRRAPIVAEWVLSHPHGLRRDGDIYRVVKPAVDPATGQQLGRARGRRPRPKGRELRVDVWSATWRPFSRQAGTGTVEMVVGRNPTLPQVVVCPACGRLNRLARPGE